jgi:phenylalanyl-tRNA synthetase beta chain
MEETIRSAAGSLLESVELFDVYRGENLPQGTKSVAFAIELLSRERTLTDSAVDACVASVVDAMGSLHGATLRGV